MNSQVLASALIKNLSKRVEEEPPNDPSGISLWIRDIANRVQQDESLRQRLGSSVSLWMDISNCFSGLANDGDDDALDVLRFVSLARNLMGSQVAQLTSRQTPIIANVVNFMLHISHMPPEYPHRSSIFNVCCTLLVNFSAHNEDNVLILRNCFFKESSSEELLASLASCQGPFVLILLDLLCPLDILGSTKQVLSKHAFRVLLSSELSFLKDHLRHKVIDIPPTYQEKLEFATSMILNTINQGATEEFYYALDQDESTVPSTIPSPAQCLFLRILCEHYHRLDQQGRDCAFSLLSEIFFGICASAIDWVRMEWGEEGGGGGGPSSKGKIIDTWQAFRVWVSTVYVLESLTALASQDKNYRNELVIKTSPEGNVSFLEALIQLLGELHKYIKPSSLRDDDDGNTKNNNNNNNVDNEAKHFAYAKVNAVALLGCIVETAGGGGGNNKGKEKEIQDRVRQLHGLELVLSSTVLDKFNPYIREYAIVCIRLLLENNLENQSIVAKLQAQKSIPSKTLEEAGYRPEIKNGSVSLAKVKRGGG